mgnify:CR=1 FL=1
MRHFIVECWDSVMNHDFNPLKHIPDLQVRHMVLQILAWMWCVAFSLYVGSWYVMGITFATHFLLIAAIALTIATFKISENVYKFKEGYQTENRARGSVIYRDKNGNPYKVKLPKKLNSYVNLYKNLHEKVFIEINLIYLDFIILR